jgi:hypothetical protein
MIHLTVGQVAVGRGDCKELREPGDGLQRETPLIAERDGRARMQLSDDQGRWLVGIAHTPKNKGGFFARQKICCHNYVPCKVEKLD